MSEVVALGGVVAQVVVWHVVARGRLPFWPATTAAFVALGIAALLAGDPACCAATAAGSAAVAGAASGAGLYAATRIVVGVASRLPPLRGAVADVYRRSEETSFAATFLLTLALAVPGEELFWRGLVQPELRTAVGPVLGALLAWLAYVGANAASASLPLLAGAIVGGAVWTALGAWSDGVVAPIASHLVWTALMLVWPPSAARGRVTS
jgi:membrane protease YdiL (CAAX protease family)